LNLGVAELFLKLVFNSLSRFSQRVSRDFYVAVVAELDIAIVANDVLASELVFFKAKTQVERNTGVRRMFADSLPN
jgi:hypothetical protein